MKKYGRAGQAADDNIIRRVSFACWLSEAANTHSEYVIIIAFPLQQRFHERASMLRDTRSDCLVLCMICCLLESRKKTHTIFVLFICTCILLYRFTKYIRQI